MFDLTFNLFFNLDYVYFSYKSKGDAKIQIGVDSLSGSVTLETEGTRVHQFVLRIIK